MIRLFYFLFPIFIFSQSNELNKLFERSVANKSSCDSLISYCSDEKNEKQKAYLGAGLILKAKYEKSTFSKISLFKKGRKKLDAVINKNPKFVESRWLRFCLQKNLPNFLNYNTNLYEDSLFILKNGNNYQKIVLND